jgi:hypothetical protein
VYTENFDNLNNIRRYDSAGHAGQGLRSPAQVTISNGILNIAGTANGTTGGLNLRTPRQKYGKWSIRAKAPAGTGKYHPVVLLWGEGAGSGTTAITGEIDILEVWQRPNRDRNSTTVHYGNGAGMVTGTANVDMTQWHTYHLTWTPTKISVAIDDNPPYWELTDASKFPQVAMDVCIQLDWFPNENFPNGTASMQVDWVKVMTLEEITTTPPTEVPMAVQDDVWAYDIDPGATSYQAKGVLWTTFVRAGNIQARMTEMEADIVDLKNTLTTIQLDLDYIKNALDSMLADPVADDNALVSIIEYALDHHTE